MRRLVLSCLGLSLAFVFSTPLGCSHARNTEDYFDAIAPYVPDAAIQVLIDLKSQHETQVRGLAYLEKFADSNLNWIVEGFRGLNGIGKTLNVPMEPPVILSTQQRQEIEALIADADDKYINRYGWLRLTPKHGENSYDNENPLLFTAEYLWMLKRLGFLTGERRTRYFEAVKNGIKAMELQPGLYDRYPVSLRGTEVSTFSHDENQGIVALDALFDYQLGYAKQQYEYGASHDFVYLNAAWSAPDTFDRPIVRSGRTVSKLEELTRAQRVGVQVEVIRRGGGAPASHASDLMLCTAMMLTLKPCKDVSLTLLNAMRASVFKNQSEVLDGCIYQFQAFLRAGIKPGETCDSPRTVTSQNAVGGLLQLYYTDLNHPIRKLADYLPAGPG